MLHESPRFAGGLLIALVEVDQGIPDQERAVPLHEVSDDGAVRTRRWIANPSAPNLQPIRFLDAEIKQPLLRYAQRIFAINVKHRALLDFEISKRPPSRNRTSHGVGQPRFATTTFTGQERDAAKRNDAVDEPFDVLL
jgi:hypothetical protein